MHYTLIKNVTYFQPTSRGHAAPEADRFCRVAKKGNKIGRCIAKRKRERLLFATPIHQTKIYCSPLPFFFFAFFSIFSVSFFHHCILTSSSSSLFLLTSLALKGLLHSTVASPQFRDPTQGISPSVATLLHTHSFSSSQGRVPRSFLCPFPRTSPSISSTLSLVRFLHSVRPVTSAHKQGAHFRQFMDPHPTRSSRYYQASLTSSGPTTYHNSYFSTSSPSYSSRDTMDPQTPFGPSSLPSQPQPPLPPRTNAHYQPQHQQRRSQVIEEQQIGGHQPSHPDGVTPDPATDLEQHCLLFPTYATTHSHSGKYKMPALYCFSYAHLLCE